MFLQHGGSKIIEEEFNAYNKRTRDNILYYVKLGLSVDSKRRIFNGLFSCGQELDKTYYKITTSAKPFFLLDEGIIEVIVDYDIGEFIAWSIAKNHLKQFFLVNHGFEERYINCFETLFLSKGGREKIKSLCQKENDLLISRARESFKNEDMLDILKSLFKPVKVFMQDGVHLNENYTPLFLQHTYLVDELVRLLVGKDIFDLIKANSINSFLCDYDKFYVNQFKLLIIEKYEKSLSFSSSFFASSLTSQVTTSSEPQIK